MSPGRVAAVDVGSNSTRLLLCETVGPLGPEGERFTTITGLGRGAASDGTVAVEALDRLDACLESYAARISAFSPDETIAVGTSAVRDAPNASEIGQVVSDRLGTELQVLPGANEAELAYVGARLAIDGDEPAVVFDIGGGSTELVRGDARGPAAAVSLDVGAVRFTEAFLRHDPPSPGELAGLRDEVASLVAPALEAIGGPAAMVGVAGTMTSLAAISIGEYDAQRTHRMRLETARIGEMAARLAAMPLEERRSVPGLHPDRAPSIVAGALIAHAVLEVAGAGAVTISERDLLDGVVLRLAGERR